MDTYTQFTHPPEHFAIDFVLWAFLVLSTVIVIYWAATTENNIENNPDKKED